MMTQNQQNQTQYLTFHVAGEEYAAFILQVKEIIEYGAVTRVPTTPDFVRGVINLRGSVVPVIDLAVMLGLPPSTVSKWSCIVIVEVNIEGEPATVGVLVDAMGQVVELLPQDIERPPPFGTRARIDCLKGMGKLGNKFVMILDIERVLGREGLAYAGAPSPIPEDVVGARGAPEQGGRDDREPLRGAETTAQ
jgi:purine-binding chemotaxis protein CheW